MEWVEIAKVWGLPTAFLVAVIWWFKGKLDIAFDRHVRLVDKLDSCLSEQTESMRTISANTGSLPRIEKQIEKNGEKMEIVLQRVDDSCKYPEEHQQKRVAR